MNSIVIAKIYPCTCYYLDNMFKYLFAVIIVALAVEGFILFNKTDKGIDVAPESVVEVGEMDEEQQVTSEVEEEMVVETVAELPPASQLAEEVVEEPVFEDEEVIGSVEIVRETIAATDLLSVGKIPPVARYTISQADEIEPAQIPFKLFTRVPENELRKYDLCYTILDNGVRASKTGCSLLTKNYSLDTQIALSSLFLAPVSEGSNYMAVGAHKFEIVVALIPSNPSISSQVTNDTSSDLSVLENNAVAIEGTGQFTFTVTN